MAMSAYPSRLSQGSAALLRNVFSCPDKDYVVAHSLVLKCIDFSVVNFFSSLRQFQNKIYKIISNTRNIGGIMSWMFMVLYFCILLYEKELPNFKYKYCDHELKTHPKHVYILKTVVIMFTKSSGG
jgi:hypothetical protein